MDTPNQNAAAVEPAVATPLPVAAAAPEPTADYLVVQQPVLDDGKYHLKGQTIRLTAARAAELGDQVETAAQRKERLKPVAPVAPVDVALAPVAPVETKPVEITQEEAALITELATKIEDAK